MNLAGKVILVDDEVLVRRAYQNDLKKNGFEVKAFESAEKALSEITMDWPGIIITDVVMPKMDGLDFLKRIKEIDEDLPVILMTGRGDIPMAVQAVRRGAFEFLEKPFPTEALMGAVHQAIEKRKLIMEIRTLRAMIEDQSRLETRIIGNSPPIQRLREVVRGVAETNSDILIEGETGTGKDLVARCLHDFSARSKHPFVAINCGALPETIIESELFGHEAGAFTGADRRRIGKFEFAHKGTVYLDEIESMPLHLQVKLLRVLQERVIERVGSNEAVPVDVRVIAATKDNLRQTSDEGRFRKDLYFRLNVIQIPLPPLRNRVEDIHLMFHHFAQQAGVRTQLEVTTPSVNYLEELKSRKWDGNIRELKNEAERFVLEQSLGISRLQEKQSLPLSVKNELDQSDSLKQKLVQFEKHLLVEELSRQNGHISKTHLALGIPRQTLCSKMKKFNLKRKDFL